VNYDFVIGQGDLEKEFRRTLTDDAGVAVDLSGASSATLSLVPLEGGTTRTFTMQIETPASGIVSYQWVEGDTDQSGFFLGRIRVVYATGNDQSFPNAGYLVVYVSPKVGENEFPPIYCSLEEVKGYVSLQGKTFADDAYLRSLRAASRGIDKAAHTRFYLPLVTSVPETRYYTPLWLRRVEIQHAVAIAAVSVDRNGDGVFEETWVENVDYVREPLNAAADDIPWDSLAARGLPTGKGDWPRGVVRSVRVEGTFGWSYVPDDVAVATSIVATQLLLRLRQAPFGVVAFGENAAARIARTDPDVQRLLSDYVRKTPLPS
jgi:hypothetical protein